MKAKEVLKLFDNMVESNKDVTTDTAYVNAKKFVAQLLHDYQVVKRPERVVKQKENRV